MRTLGADDISFETIVASGPNGSRPHHSPSDRTIERGDLVVVDFGALVDGYHSDMTRTIAVGGPSAIDEVQARMIAVVAEAQAAGVAAVAAGVAANAVDRACRAVIEAAGWAEHFVHGTGHGVGLDIHEDPRVAGRRCYARPRPRRHRRAGRLPPRPRWRPHRGHGRGHRRRVPHRSTRAPKS